MPPSPAKTEVKARFSPAAKWPQTRCQLDQYNRRLVWDPKISHPRSHQRSTTSREEEIAAATPRLPCDAGRAAFIVTNKSQQGARSRRARPAAANHLWRRLWPPPLTCTTAAGWRRAGHAEQGKLMGPWLGANFVCGAPPSYRKNYWRHQWWYTYIYIGCNNIFY
jgi:hypothetical protein